VKLLVLAVLAAALVGIVATSSAMGAQYTCTPAPVDCSGWRSTDVILKWFPSPQATDSDNCPAIKTISGEGLTRWVCRELIGSNWVDTAADIRIDKSAPPQPAPVPDRQPNEKGWYRADVRVSFVSTDAKPGIEVSGIDSCTSIVYVGPDSGGTALTGTCRDRAGNVSATASFALRYDATSPTVNTLAPARPPDHGSWYTRPIGFSVTGSDATSGLAGCDPVVYNGPDSAAAVVQGTCRDQAGNVGSRAFSVPFDATPPALRKVKVAPADDVVRLDWAAAGAASVEVSRSPGRGDDAHTMLYRGTGTRLVDRAVRNGRRYEYLFKAKDQAGNAASRTIAVVPGPRLLSPAPRARVSEPPVLRWTPVEDASYYNVQLFHEGRKVLSTWPSRARFALRRRWEYQGRRRLEPGRYRWIVWPGMGPRSRRDYGPAIGRRSFVVVPNT
jgi:hypothetical protein